MAGIAYSAIPVGSSSVSPVLTAIAFGEYTFQQGVASASWNIAHMMGYHPSIRVLDSAGTLVEGSVQYLDTNNVIVSFSAAFAGVAYLS